MHTWVEWKKGLDGQVMRRYFDNPKDAPAFAKRLREQGQQPKIKTQAYIAQRYTKIAQCGIETCIKKKKMQLQLHSWKLSFGQ